MSKYFSRIMGLVILACISLFLAYDAKAQDMEYPLPSPNASVIQKVGITEVSVKYSSPGVKGRTIWGELVPFDKVWRTGANAATEVTFSTDVNIEGKELAAGTYSLFTLPGKQEWGVMFNSRSDIGGTDYKSESDVLKIKVKPESGEFRERMAFLIENNTNNNADIVLHWEKLKLVLKLEVNTEEMVMNGAEKEIDQSWGISFRAANYCLNNDAELEKGLKYATLSTTIKEVYWNTRVKAQLEAKLGKKEAAIKTMSLAIELGSAMDEDPFDFDSMKGLLAEWQRKK
jgi:DUF2911 family protein